MHYILGDDGEPVGPVDVLVWAEWFETHTQDRILAKTKVGGAEVSTVFLGLDHAFMGGPPILYETMIFGGPDDQRDQWRYRNRHAALALHDQIVAALRDGTPLPAC